MNEVTEVSSNLEEPFDFGNNKAIGGAYSLHLDDDSRVRIVLYPDQDVPYGKFKFYIDSIGGLVFFETLSAFADVPGSGPIVLDRFLAAGIRILGEHTLKSISYIPYN